MALKDLLPTTRSSEVREDHGNPFESFRQELNRMFENFFSEMGSEPYREALSRFSPHVDVKETEKDVRISAELPGIDAKDLEISISENVLTLHGEKKGEKEEKEDRYYSRERSYGSFHRDISLPAPVDSDKATATFKHGVLIVVIPKRTNIKEKSKKIEVKSG